VSLAQLLFRVQELSVTCRVPAGDGLLRLIGGITEDARLIGRNDLAQIFWVHASGKCGRANKVRELTVTWRRSAESVAAWSLSGMTSGDGADPLLSARNAAMASSSLRRCPTGPTPRSFKSSAVNLGRTASSISLSRNTASYRSMPSLRSQLPTSMTTPLVRLPPNDPRGGIACPRLMSLPRRLQRVSDILGIIFFARSSIEPQGRVG
jgi:hypothetical protein